MAVEDLAGVGDAAARLVVAEPHAGEDAVLLEAERPAGGVEAVEQRHAVRNLDLLDVVVGDAVERLDDRAQRVAVGGDEDGAEDKDEVDAWRSFLGL